MGNKYVSAAATSAAAYSAVAPALGLPTVAALTASLSGTLTATLAAAVPAGPIIAAVVVAIKAVVKGISGNWEARERCKEAGWLWAVESAMANGGKPLGHVDDEGNAPDWPDVYPSSGNPDCWHAEKTAKFDGRGSILPTGKTFPVVTRYDVLTASRWDILTCKAFKPDYKRISIYPWFGPYAFVNSSGQLGRVPGDEAHAVCCYLASKALQKPSLAIYEVAEQLRRVLGSSMSKGAFEFLGSVVETYEAQNGKPDTGNGGVGEMPNTPKKTPKGKAGIKVTPKSPIVEGSLKVGGLDGLEDDTPAVGKKAVVGLGGAALIAKLAGWL